MNFLLSFLLMALFGGDLLAWDLDLRLWAFIWAASCKSAQVQDKKGNLRRSGHGPGVCWMAKAMHRRESYAKKTYAYHLLLRGVALCNMACLDSLLLLLRHPVGEGHLHTFLPLLIAPLVVHLSN